MWISCTNTSALKVVHVTVTRKIIKNCDNTADLGLCQRFLVFRSLNCADELTYLRTLFLQRSVLEKGKSPCRKQ